MRVVVTLGPSWEPLDGARRLTNMSTGRLGTEIANAFTAAGWDVHCLRGEGSTHPGRLDARKVESFATNDDLAGLFERIARGPRVDAIFHAAALCDYRIAGVRSVDGHDLRSPKIATRDGRLILELEPATKILPKLRGWFPGTRIIGWKYELAGGRDDALAKAWRQLRECHSDACVLNGAAYGSGFAVCQASGEIAEANDGAALARVLVSLFARGARSSTRPMLSQFEGVR